MNARDMILDLQRNVKDHFCLVNSAICGGNSRQVDNTNESQPPTPLVPAEAESLIPEFNPDFVDRDPSAPEGTTQ